MSAPTLQQPATAPYRHSADQVLTALGTDPRLGLGEAEDQADAGVMTKPPRPRGEGVITRGMWSGILYVGAIMAA